MIEYIGKGTYTSGTGALTVPPPAGISPGDLLLLIVSADAGGTVSIAGWTAVCAEVEGYASVARVYYKFAVTGEGNVTVPDIAEQRAIMTAWRNVNETPINAYTGNTDSGTTYSAANPTSTIDGCMLINCISFDEGDSADTSNYDSWVNASLESITEGHDQSDSSGGGGGIAFAYGMKTYAGAINATTATADDAGNYSASINLLLQPSSVGFMMFL